MNAAVPVRRAARALPEIVAAVLARKVTAVVPVPKVTAVVLAAKVTVEDRPAEAVAILIAASRVNVAKHRRRCRKSRWHSHRMKGAWNPWRARSKPPRGHIRCLILRD